LQRAQEVFLLKRFNTGFKDNLWSLPAGRVNKGESLAQAATREVKEETGVSINLKNLSKPLIMHYCDERGEKIYVFLFVINGMECHTMQNKINVAR
jgi:ADP-ribose pyrophosphatase YjhB (NUDIX family)